MDDLPVRAFGFIRKHFRNDGELYVNAQDMAFWTAARAYASDDPDAKDALARVSEIFFELSHEKPPWAEKLGSE